MKTPVHRIPGISHRLVFMRRTNIRANSPRFRIAALTLTALQLLIIPCGSAQSQSAAPVRGTSSEPGINRITGAAPDAKWEEEYAYALGVQAYVHLFPWVYNTLLRWRWANVGLPNMSAPVIEPNVLTHQRSLIDATYKDGGRPNNDTLYSMGWFDLSQEPAILSVPDMGTRYYTFQLVNFDNDNFAHVGTRTVGNSAGAYALVGPNWQGKLPRGVTPVAAAQTPWIIVLARILVEDESDVAAVHALQDRISIVPLSRYLGKPASAQKYKPLPPFPRQNDPLADWKTINRALVENPMPAHEAHIAKMYAQIGIGPGLDVEKVSPAVRRGLIRARDEAAAIITALPLHNAGREFVNGWGRTTLNWSRSALDGQYLIRASKALGGWIAVDAEESIYPTLVNDSNGEPLRDDRRYVLRFTKDQIPPVNAFWSITLYGPDMNFVANPIDRYSIGDRTQGLVYDTDGGVTIYLQKDAPGGDKDHNWLPTGGGTFNLMMRTYLPRPEVLDGRWQPPAVQRAD